ncbi:MULTISPECIES: hypothetical protein [unclassified Oceanispirochaeta]|uniref:hypothetical protein n=1 Tax=unclassified Oceanispirochaeta TaxID=2635722 RepID=UPI0011C02274|nr:MULTISPECIES: hypothetical protein [unclassified Oceanispirochaeta]MBF9018716.1 hypothetical protein [Oceanispirochaeta sp. M2]NPD75154.1 hypothetical protein [Oceanispirochaeta sp. M1]
MKKMKLPLAGLIVLLCTVLPLSASSRNASDIINDLMEDVFQQKLSDGEIKARYEGYSEELESLSASLSKSEYFYHKSLLEYWMGRAYQSFNDTETVINHHQDVLDGHYLKLKRHYSAIEQTVHHYDLSLQAIEAYLEIEKDSEGLRQYSEVQGQMILLRPPGYALKNGLSVKRTLKKSLKLNPDNIKSKIMEGASDIYTPAVYGGNIDKGIEKLEELILLPGCDREDIFNIYTGIAYGLIVSDRNSEAGPWLSKAKDIYPHNIYLNGLIRLAEEEQ